MSKPVKPSGPQRVLKITFLVIAALSLSACLENCVLEDPEPLSPSDITGYFEGGVVYVGATDNSEAEDENEVWRSVDGGAFALTGSLGSVSGTGDQIAHSDSSVEAGRTYRYYINVLQQGFSDVQSETVEVSIPEDEPDPGIDPPGVPVISASVDPGSGTIVISWEDVANEDGYRVERREIGGPWAQIGDDAPADSDTAVDSDPTTGTTYEYKLSAFNSEHVSESLPFEIEATGPAENPEATVYLDTVAADGRTVRQILSDESFAVHFGTVVPNVEGTYDMELDGGGGLEARLEDQVGVSINHYWGSVIAFTDEVITGVGNEFTLWLKSPPGSNYLVIQRCELDPVTGVITSVAIRVPITVSSDLLYWDIILTPQ